MMDRAIIILLGAILITVMVDMAVDVNNARMITNQLYHINESMKELVNAIELLTSSL